MQLSLSKSIFLYILSIVALSACSKEDATPLTGDLKITISGNVPGRLYYELYTEGSLSADIAIKPLLTGEAVSNPILIRSLNPGNYVLLYGGIYQSVQVTAGREREYEF